MFFDLPTKKWSLKMIAENFKDWILQGCIERDRAMFEEQKVDDFIKEQEDKYRYEPVESDIFDHEEKD